MDNPFHPPPASTRPVDVVPEGGPPVAIAEARGMANLALVVAVMGFACDPTVIALVIVLERTAAARKRVAHLAASHPNEVGAVDDAVVWARAIAGASVIVHLVAALVLVGMALLG